MKTRPNKHQFSEQGAQTLPLAAQQQVGAAVPAEAVSWVARVTLSAEGLFCSRT